MYSSYRPFITLELIVRLDPTTQVSTKMFITNNTILIVYINYHFTFS
eukprot:UN05692